MSRQDVPIGLKRWFVLHFVADWLFALPLFIAPVWFLKILGWSKVDPTTTRLVAAALIGIGTQSLIGRGGTIDTYRGMLNLKILWSGSATLGLVWSALEGGPVMVWGFVAIFAFFNCVWVYWRRRIA